MMNYILKARRTLHEKFSGLKTNQRSIKNKNVKALVLSQPSKKISVPNGKKVIMNTIHKSAQNH